MKKILILPIFITLLFLTSIKVFADDEVGQGEKIWQDLSSQKIKCADLSQDQFENLGEFFMERMVGSSSNHEAMDQRMEQMMGRDNLEQMHVVMGKRMSGCDLNAAIPGFGGGMTGMMSYSGFPLKGGVSSMMGPGMMGWSGGNGSGWMMGGQGAFWVWSVLSWITWILVVAALVAFIRWMWKKGEK